MPYAAEDERVKRAQDALDTLMSKPLPVAQEEEEELPDWAKNPTIPHYEYKITTPDELYEEWRRLNNGTVGTREEALNDFCKEGWRLVSVTSSLTGGSTYSSVRTEWYLERWVDES